MHTQFRLLVFSVFVLSSTAWAQQDAFIGTWKLNIAKSKYDPGPPPRTATTIRREASGSNGVKNTTDGMDAQGRATHTEYTASYDGKDYPVKGSASWDMAAVKRIDANTRLLVNKRGGNVVRISRQVISSDGRTQTNAEVGVNPQGQAYHNVTVYDKQ